MGVLKNPDNQTRSRGAMTERFNVSALKAEMVKAIMGSNPVRT